jgi:hypothetical protein
MAAEPPPEVAARLAAAVERQAVEPLALAGPAEPYRAAAEPPPEVAARLAAAVERQEAGRPPPEALEQRGPRPSLAFAALSPFLLSPASP